MKELFILLILVCGCHTLRAQQTVDSLIINEWQLDSYYINGKKLALTTQQKTSRHIFYSDHSCKAIDDGIVSTGSWIYDKEKKSIIITNEIHPEIKTILIIESIGKKQMSVMAEGEEKIVITMKAVN